MHLATNAYIVTSTLQNIAVAKTFFNLFIDNEITPISIQDQNITYTSFGKVNTIKENGNELLIEYGFDNQRIYSECVHKNKKTRKYYFGSFEEKIEEPLKGPKVNTLNVSYDYIAGPDGLVATFITTKQTKGNNGKIGNKGNDTEEREMLYILKDHIGSITGIVDESGELVAEYSYDAWGKRRNPQTWKYENLTELMFDRGFTGHEHLELFDLINMNGRVYDPSLGRFLSPDNYVQAPDFTQSFNRYSYCMNNPLRYTDPDGEWVHLVIGAVIGGVSGLIAGLNAGADGGELWAYIGVGAVAGALSAGIGAGVNSALAAGGSFGAGFLGTATTTASSTGFFAGFLTGAASGATNGLITGTGYGLLQGKDVGKAFSDDGISQSILQGITGGTVGGVLGGFDAVSNDRKFFTGSQNKEYYVTNGTTKMNLKTYDSKNKGTREITRKRHLLRLRNSGTPYSVTINAPDGYVISGSKSNGFAAFASPATIETEKTITFNILFSTNNDYVGAVIKQNAQVFSLSKGLQYFGSIQGYSKMYWMLSLLHLKQYYNEK